MIYIAQTVSWLSVVCLGPYIRIVPHLLIPGHHSSPLMHFGSFGELRASLCCSRAISFRFISYLCASYGDWLDHAKNMHHHDQLWIRPDTASVKKCCLRVMLSALGKENNSSFFLFHPNVECLHENSTFDINNHQRRFPGHYVTLGLSGSQCLNVACKRENIALSIDVHRGDNFFLVLLVSKDVWFTVVLNNFLFIS